MKKIETVKDKKRLTSDDCEVFIVVVIWVADSFESGSLSARRVVLYTKIDYLFVVC